MTDLAEDSVRDWLVANDTLLNRAKDQVQRLADAFLADWAVTWEFTHEGVEKARVKDAPRTHAKAAKRGVTECAQLLQRCHTKAGRERFPVQDLVGVRVLVRSLNDVAAVKRAIEELYAAGPDIYPLGNHDDFDLEDINLAPKKRGYRALHLDGSVNERGEVGINVSIPFEIQVKTLAQHVFGQHTHDEAYVADEANQDARYEAVLGLQRALAEQLNGVDLLLAQIEDVADDIRDDIERREVGDEIAAASVSNVVRKTLGLRLREVHAARAAELARRAGFSSVAELEGLIDPSGDQAAEFAKKFAADEHRGPSDRELLFGILEQAGSVEAPTADITPTSDLEDELATPTPVNPLDELDPDVEPSIDEGADPEVAPEV